MYKKNLELWQQKQNKNNKNGNVNQKYNHSYLKFKYNYLLFGSKQNIATKALKSNEKLKNIGYMKRLPTKYIMIVKLDNLAKQGSKVY